MPTLSKVAGRIQARHQAAAHSDAESPSAQTDTTNNRGDSGQMDGWMMDGLLYYLCDGTPQNIWAFVTADVVNRVRNGESIPYRPVLPETTELGKPVIESTVPFFSQNHEALNAAGYQQTLCQTHCLL